MERKEGEKEYQMDISVEPESYGISKKKGSLHCFWHHTWAGAGMGQNRLDSS